MLFNLKHNTRRFGIFAVLKTMIYVFLIIVFTIIMISYIVNSLFGKRSLSVLLELQEQKAFLYNDTERLKQEKEERERKLMKEPQTNKEANLKFNTNPKIKT